MDCRSMEKWYDQCQLVLKASHGMDFLEYYSLIHAIAEPRIAALQNGEDVEVLDGRRQGKAHTLYDVARLRDAVTVLLDHGRHEELDSFEQLPQHPTQLLDKLVNVLANFSR
ncbi:hypothetical protein FHG87_004540 [Trinorchestia longiramus]|nr:hypothetical protein FHG87_004540 [Trinorchestia longiramus]